MSQLIEAFESFADPQSEKQLCLLDEAIQAIIPQAQKRDIHSSQTL